MTEQTACNASIRRRCRGCGARRWQTDRRREGGQNGGVASDVRIGILGPLEVRVGFGEPVEIVGVRLRTLLIRLALDPDRVVLVDQLVDAVWGEDPPVKVANALQSLVARLRRLLPDVVQSHPAGYWLALDPDAVDAVRFKNLAMAGRDDLGRDPRQAGKTLREALGLWRGPALADAAAAGFAGPVIARLEELRLGALEDRIEADLAAGGDEMLVAELEELVAAHPLRERLGGQLMRALSLAGRQADALAAYQRLRRRLVEDLGIDPSEELQAIHLGVLRGETAPPPEPAADRRPREPAPAVPRTNLRAQITSFVGRADDLARITGMLGGARLVTLTGPGGAGKTRLAGEAAARLLDRMPDGVWMVELGSVADPVDLTQVVLAPLGARELGLLPPRGAPVLAPLERLVEAIGDKRLLLVMDNCEHLVDAVAGLVDHLLGRCRALRVLATSREPLGLIGEVLHPVGPLAMPDHDVPPAEAVRYPAVRLFAERGAAARPGFAVDQATVTAVLRICRALDGMPLAIELAAARVRALSPEQIAARLHDRFQLLADGGPPVLPRHRTLRAVIDWSWELLGDAERVLLRRLSVFAGGATLEAAERVCAAPAMDGLAADKVLYLLAALVDKSLVVAGETEGTGEPRYWLLETVRAYGAERRQQAGEDWALRRAHAGYFLELAERAEPELRRADQLRWLARLAAERDNLHAALRATAEDGDTVPMLQLVAALGWWWFLRSARAEAHEWLGKALALPGQAPSALRAQALAFRAMFAISGGTGFSAALGDIDAAAGLLGEVSPAERHELHPLLAGLPALQAIFRNEDAGGLDSTRELADHHDPWVRALSHSIAGALLINLGEAAAAEAEFDRALAGFRELGERWGMGQVLFARAELSAARGQREVAVAALEEAREILEQLGDREDVGQLVIRMAVERARAGDTEQAWELLAVGDRIAHEVGAEDQKLVVRHLLAEMARWQGRLDEARERLDAVLVDVERGGIPIQQRHAMMLVSEGELELVAGHLAAAHRCYRDALAKALESRDRPVIARVVELRADIALAEGDAERAAVLLGTAEVVRGMADEADVDVVRVRAAARAALGERGFGRAHRRGTAWPREEVLAALAEEVRPAGGTPAGPAARTPPR
jgi:predicted ATPase/DNA-binding SARP family transcriptional activator